MCTTYAGGEIYRYDVLAAFSSINYKTAAVMKFWWSKEWRGSKELNGNDQCCRREPKERTGKKSI